MSGIQPGFRAQPLGTAGIWDANRHKQGELVRVASNMDKEENHSGGSRLPQFVFEENQSVNYLVDSNNRINGTPFDFTVNMQQNLFRGRQLHLSRAIIPKIRNVNRNNNIIRWRFRNGEFAGDDFVGPITTTLLIGSYGVQDLANEIQTQMTRDVRVFTSTLATVLCEWQPLTTTFFLSTYLVGSGDRALYIIEDSPFIVRGKNLCPFPAFADLGLTGGPPVPEAIEGGWRSGIAGMLYTRYLTLHSAAVNQFAFAESKTSSGTQGGSIVAIFDVSSQLHTGDTFFGAFFSDTSVETDSPNIQIVNPQKQFQKFLDFQVRDEFGDILDAVFPVIEDDLLGFSSIPNNELGISFYLYVTF